MVNGRWDIPNVVVLLPGALAKNLAVSPVESPAHPNAQSFVHPALAKLGAKGKSDFSRASLLVKIVMFAGLFLLLRSWPEDLSSLVKTEWAAF